MTVSPQMGSLVGSEVTDVTALESWFFASSDVVFLGRGGQAEPEGGRPACSSPLLTPQSINLSKEWTRQEDVFPRQTLLSAQAQGSQVRLPLPCLLR